jgi:hypothetical protein
MITAELHNWFKEYITPDALILWGNVYDDTRHRWPDGTHIHTSRVTNGIFKKGDIIETLNSTYLLGDPHETISEAKDYNF